MLFAIAKLEPGQSVFINGGSTSVGIFAIQLAKATGCTVTAAASTKREDFLKSIGVDRVSIVCDQRARYLTHLPFRQFIDYTKGPVYEQLERDPPTPKFHVFIEAVGNTELELYTHSPAYLAPGGIFISVGPQPDGLKGIPHLLHYVFETYMRPVFLGGTPRTYK